MASDSADFAAGAYDRCGVALELDYDSYSKTDLSAFSDRSLNFQLSAAYVRAMVGADDHGRGKVGCWISQRAEFAQIFHNIIGYITVKEPMTGTH